MRMGTDRSKGGDTTNTPNGVDRWSGPAVRFKLPVTRDPGPLENLDAGWAAEIRSPHWARTIKRRHMRWFLSTTGTCTVCRAAGAKMEQCNVGCNAGLPPNDGQNRPGYVRLWGYSMNQMELCHTESLTCLAPRGPTTRPTHQLPAHQSQQLRFPQPTLHPAAPGWCD